MTKDKKLKEFLCQIEKFYQPINPLDKDGIGHEIEHIKGVIHRSKEITDIIEDNLELYKESDKMDMNLVTTIACLHDIGNVIGRDAHNHFGAGIVLGELNFEYIARVPMNVDKTLTTIEDRKQAIKYFHENKNKLNDLDKDTLLYKLVSEIYRTQAQFYLSYEGQNIQNEAQLTNFLKNKFDGIDETVLNEMLSGIIDDAGNFTYKYIPELKNITTNLQDVYSKNSTELYIIADAVQDHNIDFEKTNNLIIQRYASRSIYGKIVSDADKDNIPETFAIRTLAYAYNKFGRQKQLPYMIKKNKAGIMQRNDDGTYKIDMQQCLKHVCHQANERCRPSLEEYLSENPNKKSVMPIFPDTLNYKELSKIKGVTINPDGAYEIYTPQHGNMKYDITIKAGDDVYSELDALSGNSQIKDLRSNYIQKMHKWGDPERMDESLEELQPILNDFIESPSLEEAVDYYEKQYWQVKDNSFSNIIDTLIISDNTTNNTNSHKSLDQIISENKDTKTQVNNYNNDCVEID